MELSMQVVPLRFQRHAVPWLYYYSPSQVSLMKRKSQQLRSVRCSGTREGEGQGKSGSPQETGSWLPQGQPADTKQDPFSGWTSSEAQLNDQDSSTGWLKFGGVLLLSIGFSLGARSLHLRREAARELTVPPATEQTVSITTGEKNGNMPHPIEYTIPEATAEENASLDESNNVPEINDEKPLDNVQKCESVDDLQHHEEIAASHVSLATDDSEDPTHDKGSSVSDEQTFGADDSSRLLPVNEVGECAAVDVTGLQNNLAEDAASGNSSVLVNVAGVIDCAKDDVFAEDSSSSAVPGIEMVNEDVDANINLEGIPDEDGINFPDLSTNGDERAQNLDVNPESIAGHYLKTESAVLEFERQFSASGVTAPCTPTANLPKAGKVVVPASLDHMQEHVFAALQALKVVEAGMEPTSICTRREYARWLIAASAALSRSPAHKVFPAMYIENVSKLAYDDVLPDDQDFPFIQGLAEAGLISSRLLADDILQGETNREFDSTFSPDSPLTRQDLITWKIALEQKSAFLAEAPSASLKEKLQEASGFIDIDKINEDAWLPLLADVNAGERSIMTLAFGYTRRFQPGKPVTKAQAAVALASGEAWELVSEELARLEADSIAEAAVTAELAWETRAQQEVAAAYQERLQSEREKQEVAANMLEKTLVELEQLKLEREEEKKQILREHAVLESEREFLLNMRREVEGQAFALSSERLHVAFEKEKAEKLHAEAEEEIAAISKIRTELEIEKKALALARTWAEEEAKKAIAHFKVLEEMRNRWEIQGVQVHTEEELPQANIQGSSLNLKEQFSKNLFVDSVITKSRELGQMFIDAIIRFSQYIQLLCDGIKQQAIELSGGVGEKFQGIRVNYVDTTMKTIEELKRSLPASAAGMSSTLRDSTLKAVDGWKEGAEKFVQKLKIS